MNLAQRALAEYAIHKSKHAIEEKIMNAAKSGVRYIELDCLPCYNENVPTLIKWMQDEGLKVKHDKWKAKPTGFGVTDDDEEVEYSKYTISY